MRTPGRGDAGRGGLTAADWGVIVLLQLGTLVVAFIIVIVLAGVDQFEFSGPFKDGDGLEFEAKRNRFERTNLVRCINDLCDVDMVSEANEDLCLVVTWTNEGPEGFLVLPRPCSTGVEIGDLEDVDTGGASPGECLCTPDGEEFVPSGPFQLLAEKAQPNGYCPLNGLGIVPDLHLPPELVRMQGCWNANTNVPILMSGGCPEGDIYVVSVPGSTMLDGNNDWNVGDALICSQGNFWKAINSQKELDDLLDVDTTGQMNGDVLRRIGGTWVPDDTCCVGPVGGAQIGFFANHSTGSQFLPENMWTPVEYVIFAAHTFFQATFIQIPGQSFNNNDHTFTVAVTGWYSVHASLTWNQRGPGSINLNKIGKRGFRLRLDNADITEGEIAAKWAENDNCGGGGASPGQNFADNVVFTIQGVYPFCLFDVLTMEALSDSDQGGYAAIEQDYLGETWVMTWSMWRIPDGAMPKILICGGAPAKRENQKRRKASDIPRGQKGPPTPICGNRTIGGGR